MWCPKCKTEYTEGITKCADCGTELIEKPATADFINICEVRDERTADDLLEFLTYSKVEGAVKERTEDSSGFQIMVSEKSVKKAEKMVHGYLLGKEEEKKEEGTEKESLDSEESLKENPLLVEEVEEDTAQLLHASEKNEYVKTKDRYDDLRFSGITFIIFGVLGSIYLILSKLEIIPISYNLFIFCVISVLFVGFIISGILSFSKAGKLKALIPEEEKKITEIKEWLKENIKDGLLEEWTDSSVSPSENDLILIAHIQVLLRKQFPDEEKSFLEMIADEYYDENVLAE